MTASAPWNVAVTMKSPTGATFCITHEAMIGPIASPVPRISNMPPAMQYLTYANPLRYAIDLVRRVYLEGASFGYLLHDMWPLVVIALVTLPAAVWLFRHRLV